MKTIAAQTSKVIKQELKKAFPEVKFSVKSDNYSGGNSVNIEYWDAMPLKEVEEIVSKYQQGHFNGMEDIYEYSNTNKNIPQAKFVFTKRNISTIAAKKIVSAIEKHYGINIEVNYTEGQFGHYREFAYKKYDHIGDQGIDQLFFTESKKFDFRNQPINNERAELEALRAWKKQQAA